MNIVTKDPNLHIEVLDMAKSLYGFMKSKFNFTCEPSIHFMSDVENAEKILGKTGYYNPHEESVHVYITNRHPKDILRSLAHELLHHIQGCEGMVKADDERMKGTKDPNYLIHDKFLRHIEADAFKRGNVVFREWEAHVKEGDVQVSNLNEKRLKKGAKVPKKKLKKYKTSVKKMADKIKKSNPDIPDAIKFGTAANLTKQKMHIYAKEEQMEKLNENKQPEQQKEVQINDALKNSLYYVEEDRPLGKAYNARDEKIYNELLRKFKIKK